MNIQFNYLYRDGANYKQHHSVVFSNIHEFSIEKVNDAIGSALIENNWFYTDKWKLPDAHFYGWDNEIDHMWHEYDSVENTEANVTNGDISDFMRLIL